MGGSKNESELEQLAQVALFEGVSKRGLRQIAAMAKEMRFAPGEELTTESTRGGRFHLILEGEATVSNGSRTLATLGPGDTIGEMSLIDGEPRSATVRATRPMRTLTVASWSFRSFLRKEPSIMEKVMLQLVHRLREADRSLVG